MLFRSLKPLIPSVDKIGPLVIDVDLFGAAPSETSAEAVSTPEPAATTTEVAPPETEAPAPIASAPPQETAAPEPPLLREVPPAIEKAMPITPRMIAADVAKPVQAFAAAPTASPSSVLPEFQALPLRPKMALGPTRLAEATPAEPKKTERASSSIFDKIGRAHV